VWFVLENGGGATFVYLKNKQRVIGPGRSLPTLCCSPRLRLEHNIIIIIWIKVIIKIIKIIIKNSKHIHTYTRLCMLYNKECIHCICVCVRLCISSLRILLSVNNYYLENGIHLIIIKKKITVT